MKKLFILISGTPGSGKSTLTERLAEEFKLKRIFASGIMKQIKEEANIDIEKASKGTGFWESDAGKKLVKERQKNFYYDIELDKRLLSIAEKENRAIFDSRMMAWLYKGKDAFRIWVDASPNVRAKRIAKRDRKKICEVAKAMEKRLKTDAKIYKKLYNVDIISDRSPFDLVIKTDNLDADDVFEIAATAIRRFFKISN
ncbi:MAG: cytidylate kinase family protein [Candidatus Diapherotrites archaeon]|nr:cytidylate kinase family protein [Candidatus Diapherotrites archaeon]